MELIDWKNVEMNCESSIRTARIQQELEEIMLDKAKQMIKELGGKTSEEEKRDMKIKTVR